MSYSQNAVKISLQDCCPAVKRCYSLEYVFLHFMICLLVIVFALIFCYESQFKFILSKLATIDKIILCLSHIYI